MKLHLPSGLRKSLLACMAALAIPAFTTTLGSATSAFSGAALVSFIAAHQATAASEYAGDLHFPRDTENNQEGYTADEDLTVTGSLWLDENVEEGGPDAMDTANTTITIDGSFTVQGGLKSSGIVAVLEEKLNPKTDKIETVVKKVKVDEETEIPLQNWSALTVKAADSKADNVFVIGVNDPPDVGGDLSNFNRGLILENGVDLHVKANTALSYLSYGEGSNITIGEGATLSFGVVTTTYRDENGKNLEGAVYFQKDSYITGDLHLYGEGTLDVKQNLFEARISEVDGKIQVGKLEDLYLNGNVTIKFSQKSYGKSDELGSGNWFYTRGSVFGALRLGDDADVTIQFGSNKSAVTFVEKFTLRNDEAKSLTFEMLEASGTGESGLVYFQQGAEIDTLVIKGHRLTVVTAYDDIHVKEIKGIDYKASEFSFVNYKQVDNKINTFYIDDEKDWSVDFGLEAGAINNADHFGQRVCKTGVNRVTFKGDSTTDILDVQAGKLFFLSREKDGERDDFDSVGYDEGYYDAEKNAYIFTSTTTVASGATLGLGVRNASFYGDLKIEGDLDLSYGVLVSVGTMNRFQGNCEIGGLTTILYSEIDDFDDNITGTGYFKTGTEWDAGFTQNVIINVTDVSGNPKKSFGISFNGNNLIKLGVGTQIFSNYGVFGDVTLGTEENLNAGVLELRDQKGRIIGQTTGADPGALLLIHRYEAEKSSNIRTNITFAREINMSGSLGLDGGVDAYLGAESNTVGGLVGDSDLKGQYNSEIVNHIRLATIGNFDYEDIRYYHIEKDEKDNDVKVYDEDPWWEALSSANLTIDIGGDTTRRTHGGMLVFDDGITLVKDGAGMQEVTGILANTLIVKEGRFRITGVDEYGGHNWLEKRVIDNITVDGAKERAGEGEKAYFEVSVQDANYWTVPNTAMTLLNGGIFRAAGKGAGDTSKDAVTSEFYVGKLYVSRSSSAATGLPDEDMADGYIKWNRNGERFSTDASESRADDSHKFVFGLLSSVGEDGLVDCSREYMLVVDDMTRGENASQHVTFQRIKDFNGTIHSSVTGSGNYFQIGVDVADLGFVSNEENDNGRTGLDTSVVDTVNTGAYAEGGAGQADKVFNTVLNVDGAGVYSEVFRKRGDGKLTIDGDKGLTIGRDGNNEGGVIFMNYAGEIDITSGKINVGNNVTLLYTTGENNVHNGNFENDKRGGGVISYLTVEQLCDPDLALKRVYIDLLHLENVEDLYLTEYGISLGIMGDGEQSLDELEKLLFLRGINTNETTWELKWGPDLEEWKDEKKTVYLHVTSGKVVFTENDFLWDKAWGGVAYFAPTSTEMQEQEFCTTTIKQNPQYEDFSGFVSGGTNFADNALSLADSAYRALSDKERANSADRMSIRLIGGGAGINDLTTATVIGGRLYKADEQTDLTQTLYWEVRGNSYISLIDPSKYESDINVGAGDKNLHFHLLVGGSSCLFKNNDTMGSTEQAVGGFYGNSHIQMNGGQVDYIVGGNHVNNSAFIFRGRAFISVFDGDVYGGIVGGSTLTKGSINKYTQAFDGSTHIFVHTLLMNNAPADTPAISDGTQSADGVGGGNVGESFTAIVGGNAWIDLPGTVVNEGVELRPTFYGNSNIVIDLVSEDSSDRAKNPDGDQFEKDIVGGNYTVYAGAAQSDNAELRGTEYISNGLTSYVMVKANEKHIFTGSINGASRRASGGGGWTYYTGDVQVQLRGGEYHKAVVGGLWLDASASGDHKAKLVGNTVVDAGNSGAGDAAKDDKDDAYFWRLVGGSFSLAGGDSSEETSKGSSTVNLWSGTVSNEHADYADDIAGMDSDSLRALQLQVAVVVGGNLYRNNTGNSQTRTGDTYVNLYGGNLEGVHVVGGDQVNSSTTPGVKGATGATIDGTSHVTVGTRLGEEMSDPVTSATTKGVTVNGLIVGGSYLTDAGTGGSVTVTSTEIYLRGTKDAPVNIQYEQGETVHTHSLTEIAIVGGNMLVDQETGGSHTLEVKSSTTIEMFDRVNITGNMVGGSYTNGTPNGQNTIGTTGQSVDIKIHGGKIFGNVYGGHYSSNTKMPDVLSIGNITITMDNASSKEGGEVIGNIVGGGYRTTVNDADSNNSTQGDILIKLENGYLYGDVYAAGYNAGEVEPDGVSMIAGEEPSDGASMIVATVTASTHVIVEAGYEFVDHEYGEEPAAKRGLVISGGYGRADESVARGTITDDAIITFNGSNTSINKWNADNVVSLSDATIVEVWNTRTDTASEINVAGDLGVLRQKNSITKRGEGSLRVHGLNTWDDDDSKVCDYRGKIIVDDGYLKLTGDEVTRGLQKQDLSGGLKVNLASAVLRHYQTKENAYLQGHELLENGTGMLYVNTDHGKSLIEFDFVGTKNENTGETPTLDKLHYGKYYLATGLDKAITKSNKTTYFNYAAALAELQDRIDEWAETDGQYKYYVADIQIIDNSLVLRVRDEREMFGWWWGCFGDKDDAHMDIDSYDEKRGLVINHDGNIDDAITWEDGSSINWTQHGTQDLRYDATHARDPFTDGKQNAWDLASRGQDLHFGATGSGTTLNLKAEIDYKTGEKYASGSEQKGKLAPRSIWVQDAQYTFTSDTNATLSIGTDEEANADADDLMLYLEGNPNKDIPRLKAGELRVGGNYWGKDKEGKVDQSVAINEAELVMGVSVAAMSHAYLADKGALVLDHAEAITKQSSIHFDGGLLGYTINSASLGDLSAQVSADSTSAVRIRVGETAIGAYHDNTPTKRNISITWGQTYESAINRGVKLALETGFEKSGVDSFTLKWFNRDDESKGYVKVLEGELTYMSQSDRGDGILTDRLTGEVLVKGGAKMTYLVTGNQRAMNVAGAITGAGHVVIGSKMADYRSAETTLSPYRLSGDNSGFDGVLELLGASKVAAADLVGMKAATAAGGTSATLRLAGRHLYFTEGAAKTIAVGSVQIVDDSVNYVGGFVDNKENESITITGKLEWTNDEGKSEWTEAGGETAQAKKNGILANAWGTAGEGFHHTYNGASLSGFTGTILAGAGATKTGPTTYAAGVPDSSDSTWKLKDDTDSTTEIQAYLGGAGSFVFEYNQNIRLTGYVGVDEGDSITADDKKTSISNAQAGKQIVTIADGENADWTTGSVNPDTSITALEKVTGHNIATGSISGGFVLGDENFYGTWSGTVLNGTEGTAFTLVNGVLKNALTKAADNKALLKVATEMLSTTSSTKVDVGGTQGSEFDSITITDGGQMLGAAGVITVDGKSTKVELTLTKGNVANTPGTPGAYLIVGQEADGVSMSVTDAKDFTLNLNNTAFREMLKRAMNTTLNDSEKKTYLHIVSNGSLEIADALHEDLLKKVKGVNTDLVDMLGWSVVSGAQTPGDIILAYQKSEGNDPGWPGGWEPPMGPVTLRPREIYLVIDSDSNDWKNYSDPHTVTEYGRISSHFKATFIDDGQTLDVTLVGSPKDQEVGADPQIPFPLPGDHQKGIAKDKDADGALVNNLVGMEDAHFVICNGDTAKGRVNVVFCNMKYENPEDIWMAEEYYDTTTAYGLDTEYWGELNGGAGVDLRKTGRGRLTIGAASGTGHLQLEDGTLIVDQGSMTLQGDENKMAELAFRYTTEPDAAMGEERTFWLKNGTTTIGVISEKKDKDTAGRIGADIAMDGAKLILTGKSVLADSSITGRSDGRTIDRLSEVEVAEEAVLTLTRADKAQLSNVGLILDAGGKADMGGNVLNSVRGLSGEGTLAGKGAVLAVTDNLVDANNRAYAFSGTLDGTGNKIIVEKDAKLLLANAIGGDGWDVTNEGSLIIDVSGQPKREDKRTHLGNLTLGSGSATTLRVNTDLQSRALPTMDVESITAGDGAIFYLETTGSKKLLTENSIRGPRYGVAYVRSADQNSRELSISEPGANMIFIGKGAEMWRKDIVDAYIESGVLWLQMKEIEDNPLQKPGLEKNPNAGAELVWDATDPEKNPHYGDITNPDSELGKAIDSVLEQAKSGNDHGMQNTLAAIAGSSTSVYGMVMAEDIHRQLRTTRNRAVMAASERCWSGVNCPLILHAYIMGEGSYNKLNTNKYAPGYTLSNWGGTLGVDADIHRKVDRGVNVGLSITAMYGDLRVNSPDRLKADMDTQYMSAYLRVDRGKWQHTLALSWGRTDMHNISRTVTYAPGQSYTTYGETDGYSVGGIYELGYNIVTNEEGTSCLQMVGNVEMRHVSLNAYTENGSDAALHVGKAQQDVLTLGAGGRYRTVIGYNLWNRAATLEARALAKADVGDRSGTEHNALVNGTPTRREVESAKIGAVGVEIGAGLSIPTRRCGIFFMDAALELRQGAMHADANVGYRMTF